MLQLESRIPASGEEQLTQVVHDNAEALRTLVIQLNKLTDAEREDVLVFEIVEVGEYLSYFLLHSCVAFENRL